MCDKLGEIGTVIGIIVGIIFTPWSPWIVSSLNKFQCVGHPSSTTTVHLKGRWEPFK